MNILALNFGSGDFPTACEIYRTNLPLTYMSLHDHKTAWMPMADLAKKIREQGIQYLPSILAKVDLLVMARAVSLNDSELDGIAGIIEIARKLNKPVVFEVDDDFTNQHRNLGDFTRHTIEIASWCDSVTVTTKYLSDLMRKETNLDTYILPNCIDPNVWNRTSEREDEGAIVIGLTGSSTHYNDWKVLSRVFKRILKNQYEKPVKIKLGAFHPDYFNDLPNTERIPPLHYSAYAELVRSCDIILAPVNPLDLFNHSKSSIKAVEGLAATRKIGNQLGGAFCIVSDAPPYSEISDGIGLKVKEHTADAWYNAIDSVLNLPELERNKIQINGRKWVYKNRNMETAWKKWETAYKTIIKSQRNTFLPYTQRETHVRS